MAISASLLASSAGSFPFTLTIGPIPAGAWLVITVAGVGAGGSIGVVDSAGNTYPTLFTTGTDSSQPICQIFGAKVVHAIPMGTTLTYIGSPSYAWIWVWQLTGAPNFIVGGGHGISRGRVFFPSPAPVHETDLRFSVTASGESLFLGVVCAYTGDPVLFPLALDVDSSAAQVGLGAWYTGGEFQTLPVAGATQIGAQVTGPPGGDAWSWASSYVSIIGLGLPGCDGCDLVRSSAGWLFGAWQDDGTIYVGRSLDQGDNFDRVIAVSADGDPCCAPALTIDRHDDLLLAYHTVDPLLRIWRLPELLEADPVPCFDFLTITHPYQFPRTLVLPTGELLIAADNGDNLQIYRSPDLGVTTILLKDYAQQAIDRSALVLDRFGIVHHIYRDLTDTLQWDWSADFGVNWNGIAPLAGGKAPAMAGGVSDGFVAFFSGGTTLVVQALNSDFHSIRATVASPPATMKRLPLGAWIDGRAESGREDWWLFGRAAAAPPGVSLAKLPCYSPDHGDNWTVLAGGGL